MMNNKYTQSQQVIDTMRKHGGYSTLGNLYNIVDTSSWKTKTPQESIRRIVQQSKEIFKIEPGLWALEECRDEVLMKFKLHDNNNVNRELFTHSYYQGLITEIRNMKKFTTYVPAQDKNKLFLERALEDVCSTIKLPDFGYKNITDRAKTVDVIWFNERMMPDSLFEVEHSTDIQNSLLKFFDLRDYFCRFFIVADERRHKQYDNVISRSVFKEIKDRVKFQSYEKIINQYDSMCIQPPITDLI